MKQRSLKSSQRGVAMAISLLFLLVVTIIAVTAARNSSLSLKISANMQDQNNSLQSVEAGLFGLLGFAGTGAATDPFLLQKYNSQSEYSPNQGNPFHGLTALDQLNDPNSVETTIFVLAADGSCPRARAGSGGTSVDRMACDYFRIDAEHEQERRARTRASLGVVKPVLR